MNKVIKIVVFLLLIGSCFLAYQFLNDSAENGPKKSTIKPPTPPASLSPEDANDFSAIEGAAEEAAKEAVTTAAEVDTALEEANKKIDDATTKAASEAAKKSAMPSVPLQH
ncbi:MAG: hypothetical protein ACTSXQ_06835 [Alphaproteobacteria bacterium]